MSDINNCLARRLQFGDDIAPDFFDGGEQYKEKIKLWPQTLSLVAAAHGLLSVRHAARTLFVPRAELAFFVPFAAGKEAVVLPPYFRERSVAEATDVRGFFAHTVAYDAVIELGMRSLAAWHEGVMLMNRRNQDRSYALPVSVRAEAPNVLYGGFSAATCFMLLCCAWCASASSRCRRRGRLWESTCMVCCPCCAAWWRET